MRALFKDRAAPGLTLKNAPVPKIGPRDALVKVRTASICGTDLHIYEWDGWSQSHLKPPLIVGHELAGEVVEVGSQVTEVKKGDFVAAESHIFCGRCKQCREGNAHVCEHLKILGVDRDGCFAEYVSLPAENLWVNGKDLDPMAASVQEPLGNAVHSTTAWDVKGQRVLITGCGPIGVCCAAVAKKMGAAKVYATDVNDYRLNLAKKMGADVTVNVTREDPVKTVGEVDILLEMSGNPKAFTQGLQSLRTSGKVSMLGLFKEPFPVDFSNLIVLKGISIYGVCGRKIFGTWKKMAALLHEGLDVRPLVTHTMRLEDYEKAFELMKKGECGKIVLKL